MSAVGAPNSGSRAHVAAPNSAETGSLALTRISGWTGQVGGGAVGKIAVSQAATVSAASAIATVEIAFHAAARILISGLGS